MVNDSTKVLIVDTDVKFYGHAQEALSDFNIEIDLTNKVESCLDYDFYFLGEVIDDVISCIERIRAADPNGKIFIFDNHCNDIFPLKKVLHLNISGCIGKNVNEVSQTVGFICRAKSKMNEVSKRLDDLKKEMLKKPSISHLDRTTI